ncbi:MAG: acyl-CoA/acyl-ACP dehydrogenase, partial [Pseudomonadales bacterium]|nr:acyl-CoA/acyl-ACP dehydrogenase [Pseudomonadales bacterium]
MDFKLTEEQQDIQNLASQILGEQVTPEELHKYDMWKEERFNGRLWAQLADAGLLGITIPVESGGMGFGFAELALLIEECGRVVAPLPVVPSLISAMAIQSFGDENSQRMLGGVATGEVVLTAAIAEPCNFDLDKPTTTIKDGKISGEKLCVPYANIATRILVIADDGNEAGLYLVDPKSSGVHLTALKATTYEPQYNINLENAAAEKIGGASAVKYLIEHYCIALCAYQVGVAEQMVKMTAAYTSEREQFNVKIATFQAVGHRTANCYIDAKCLKLVTQQAVMMLASGQDASRQVHVAKIWLGDAAHRISYA